ncbi:DUF2484 family protein [Flavimaricola marinus]|uniref:DUF2484 family protein n=1 Tax=Flavimaricola marinus TaxID=1819565 RepID=A0A238LDM7_9RHOB|nr:DUF2484 family protein [Flavimaricola marinus]SMY07718.1 hypothetical protein LOM8899_01858 [Flavimaricola marinus]
MSLSLVLAFVWLIVANVLALIPSRDNHWQRAYALIALGVPLLGFVTWQNGPIVGIILLIAGVSVLRWPVIYLGRWFRARILGGKKEVQ